METSVASSSVRSRVPSPVKAGESAKQIASSASMSYSSAGTDPLATPLSSVSRSIGSPSPLVAVNETPTPSTAGSQADGLTAPAPQVKTLTVISTSPSVGWSSSSGDGTLNQEHSSVSP